jgi:hypothetical protein
MYNTHSVHQDESFMVEGVTFEYSDYDLSKCGFNNTASHGSPIREGLSVRISYRDDRILKIEIPQQAANAIQTPEPTLSSPVEKHSPLEPFDDSLWFTRYFWVLAIGMTILNAQILRKRSIKFIQQKPELEEDYDKVYKGYIIFLNLPWVVMGIGIIFGNIRSAFEYFNIRGGNPYILAFYASIVVIWILIFVWINFRGGAEFLVEHPGYSNVAIQSPTLIKLYTALALAGGIAVLVFLWISGW